MFVRPVGGLKRFANTTIGIFAVVMFKMLRLVPPNWLSNFCGAFMRLAGPWLPEHKIGRANLIAAYPEKSLQEIEAVLLGVWENLGRVGGEFVHLDRLWDHDPVRPERGRILASEESYQRMLRARDSGKPALAFSAHLANWELAAMATTHYGFDTAIIYRPPNVGAVADAVIKMRAGIMGTLIRTGIDAPLKAAEALQRGAHVGMLVDQYSTNGVDVTFFGRPARTTPLLARLAQHFDCQIYGVHVVRHGGTKFQLHLTEPMDPVRDAKGNVDVQATMQMITSEVERWVRDNPEQWLWLHRRWR